MIAEGNSVLIIKGMRDAWATRGSGVGAYVTIKRDETWSVSTVSSVDAGLCIVLTRGGSSVRLYTSAAGKTNHAEFNLNNGDPTRSIRVRNLAA